MTGCDLDPEIPSANSVLSVSRLTRRLQSTLREKFVDLWVAGEVSNLTQPGSGHIYLTLGDDRAQIKAVIWRSEAEAIDFDLANGMQVICRGEIDIYPPRGVYQLLIRQLEPQGLGRQQQALKRLHAKLAAEGLFQASRKRDLPALPRLIGVITSPSGAAIQDFLQVVTRRWPDVEILIIPARVQGDSAAVEVAQGIGVASQLKRRPDVLVVTRGGGSAEDLWAFNDERLVRTIAACPIPLVSAVGHEIDVTLCDLVADVRALTPSEAGELVVPVFRQVQNTVADLQSRLQQALLKRVASARERLLNLAQRRVMQQPDHLMHIARRQVDELELRLMNLMHRHVERSDHRLAVLAGRLQAISPLNVLARGYSVTETLAGAVVRDPAGLAVGDQLVTRLERGGFTSQVVQLQEPMQEPPDKSRM